MDAFEPKDNSLVSLWPAFIREVRAKYNELEALFQTHITGGITYGPVEISTASHNITSGQTFIKANAGAAAQLFTVDPAALTVGLMYILKKTDASANTVTMQTTSGLIDDNINTIQLLLQYEVIRFISDGVGIQTC